MHSDHTSDITPLKKCSKCEETKPATAEFFSRDKTRRDGLFPQCRKCKSSYNSENKERISDYNRTRRAVNREIFLQRDRDFRDKHRDIRIQYMRDYHAKNRDRLAQQRSAYGKANREKLRAREQHRRALELGAEGHYTEADVRVIFERQEGHCYYCNKGLDVNYHVDHVVPLSRGGSNWPENLVIACPTCNISKHNKLLDEWLKEGRLQ